MQQKCVIKNTKSRHVGLQIAFLQTPTVKICQVKDIFLNRLMSRSPSCIGTSLSPSLFPVFICRLFSSIHVVLSAKQSPQGEDSMEWSAGPKIALQQANATDSKGNLVVAL